MSLLNLTWPLWKSDYQKIDNAGTMSLGFKYVDENGKTLNISSVSSI
jgi:hypothetical protein